MNHEVRAKLEDTRAMERAAEAFAFEKTESGLRRFEADTVKPAEFCQTDTYCTDDYCSCSATGPDCPNCDAGVEEDERCCTYSNGSTSCEIADRRCVSECVPDC
jgi:hypothetical protein